MNSLQLVPDLAPATKDTLVKVMFRSASLSLRLLLLYDVGSNFACSLPLPQAVFWPDKSKVLC